MPERWARAAMAFGLPPLDLPAYQIHMPSPSKALGVGANCGVAIGGATVSAGRLAAPACAGGSASAAVTAAAARAMWRRVAGYERTWHFYHGSVKPVPISRRPRL